MNSNSNLLINDHGEMFDYLKRTMKEAKDIIAVLEPLNKNADYWHGQCMILRNIAHRLNLPSID